jgi:hypothetical protein
MRAAGAGEAGALVSPSSRSAGRTSCAGRVATTGRRWMASDGRAAAVPVDGVTLAATGLTPGPSCWGTSRCASGWASRTGRT